MNNINQMVIRTALRNMFNKGYINVSTIDECLKLSGITPLGETRSQLRALHCVEFKDMDRQLAEAVPGMVAELFEGITLSIDEIFDKPQATDTHSVDITPVPKGNAFLRLIGMK